MLIAVSGSQGSGKSTLIKALANEGYNVIERKTSRSILTDWGVTLQEVNNDHELTVKFQEEISKRKYEDEKAAAESSDWWVTERTHTDLFVYALIAMGKENNYSDWIDQYHKTCSNYNKMYQHVFYLKGGLFPVENDGVRAINTHYSRMVDVLMSTFNERMISTYSAPPGKGTTYTEIRFPDIAARVDLIKSTVLTYSQRLL